MNIALTKKDCCGCHGCAIACPKQCITMERDEEGFWYPRVDESACVHCGLCEKVCPVLNAVPADETAKPAAYAAMNEETGIRLESSSGGVFSALAQQVIASGGIVFGAAWSENFREVRHIGVESMEDLALLRGSKYVQSTMGDCYARAKNALAAGRQVLFSGTPCQVEGFQIFLGKEYENLLLVDIICHGVPSPDVWKKYLEECEKSAGAPVRSVEFRNKDTGWQSSAVKLVFTNGKVQSKVLSEDYFINAFLRNACLRPSCHDCRFKKLNRVSDVTLADFWGVETICPELEDDKGTSLVLVHSEKGHRILEGLALKTCAVDLQTALKENHCAVKSSPVHPNRDAFMKALETQTFGEAVRAHVPRQISLKERIANTLARMGLLQMVRKLLGKR